MVAETLSNLGEDYYFSEALDLEKANEFFDKAYHFFLNLGLIERALLNLNYSAYIDWARGSKEKALKTHLEVFRKSDSLSYLEGMAYSASDGGFTLNTMGSYQEALEYNLEALKFEKILGRTDMTIPTLNNIAVSLKGLKRYEEALDYSTQSMNLAKKLNLNLRIKEAANTLHQIYQLQENFEKAYHSHLLFKQISDSINSADQIKKLVSKEISVEFERELQTQKTINQVKATELSYQRVALIIFSIILIILVILIIALWFVYLQKKEVSDELQDKNLLLAETETKLKGQNEELNAVLNELKVSQAEIVQSEKMSSLGTLVRGAAHEVNNPLNFIQVAVQKLQDQPNLSMEDKEGFGFLLHSMQEGVRRINDIIESLNSFDANDISMEKVTCDLVKIIEECITLLAPEIEKRNCQVIRKYSNPSESIRAIGSSLYQIVINILMNAIQSHENPDGEIEISTVRDNQQVVLTFKDNGLGIKSDHIQQIFDPFFTTKDPGAGTGLGLSLAQNHINQHKGTISVESEYGQGTLVTISLPR